MENIITLMIPALLGIVALRLVILPMRWLVRVAVHAGCGLLCLILLNTVSGFTGILFPINVITILVAGFLGVPGIGLLALLEVLV